MKIQTITGVFESNTFIVETREYTLIIDAGATLQDVLKTLGERSPAAILLTHEHFDHVYHIADYIEKFNCPVICHPATLSELKTNEINSFISRIGEVRRPQSFDNFISLNEESFITFESRALLLQTIKVLACPGHSKGSIAYLINGNLFTGDVLFANTIGRTDLITMGEELMQISLRFLKNLKFHTAYHGHSKSSNYINQQKNILKHIKQT